MLVLCSRSARPRKGLARRPQLNQAWVSFQEGKSKQAWKGYCVSVVGRAQWEINQPPSLEEITSELGRSILYWWWSSEKRGISPRQAIALKYG